MPGTVDSKVGDSLGKASRSGPVNSIPIDSTKPRGATEPSRATITSHAIFSSPSGVSSVSQPGSTFFGRSEEHTSELQSLMRISTAVFCLKTKNQKDTSRYQHIPHIK